MYVITKTVCSVAVLVFSCFFASRAEADDLAKIERTMAKEPQYKSQPKYCLLVFGNRALTRVWLVQDGDTLYVDRNGNGDLTEEGERIGAKENKFVSPDDEAYQFEAGDIPDGGLVHRGLMCGVMRLDDMAAWDPDAKSLLAKQPKGRGFIVKCDVQIPGLTGGGVGGRVDQLAGPRDLEGFLQFSDKPERAPIIHFGGPLQISLYGDRQQLVIGRRKQLVLALGTPGVGHGTTALAGHEGFIPADVHPQMEIVFPAKGNGDEPLRANVDFKERCCTYNFLAHVPVQETVGRGKAEVTIRFDAWPQGNAATSEHKIDVVRPKSNFQLEEVSPRLRRSLIHQNRQGVFTGLRFSSDGNRFVAGDYPGGVIQVWEVESGKQLTKIETGYGFRGGDEYFFVSPDWKFLYVSREKREPKKIERDGKQLYDWTFDSDIRVWDLESGELKATYRSNPTRGIRMMVMSPDGSQFMVGEELPGESAGPPPRGASLVDARSGQFRPVPGQLSPLGTFSGDSRILAVAGMDEQSFSSAIHFFDVATGELKHSLAIDEKLSLIGYTKFSPSGNRFVSVQSILPKPGAYREAVYFLKFWDPNSRKEIVSVRVEETGSVLSEIQFSHDGRTLAATSFRGKQTKLLLFDALRGQLVHSAALEEKGIARRAEFSPDDTLIAVSTQVLPDDLLRTREPAVEDTRQPRIHLIDTATGRIRETLVAPQAFCSYVCFSPDGKTLATGGNGEVLLWNVEMPAGDSAGQ